MKSLKLLFIAPAMLLLSTIQVQAQQTTETNPYVIMEQAQAAILKKTNQMIAKIAEVRKRFEAKKINEEQMERELEAISDRYEREIEAEAEKIEMAAERISEEAERYAAEAEEHARRAEEEALLGFPAPPDTPEPPTGEDADWDIDLGNGGIEIESDEDRKIRLKLKGKPRQPRRTNMGFHIAFGWNTYLLNGDKQEGVSYPEMNFWQGSFSEWALMWNTRLGGSRSPIWLNYGASLMYHKVDLDDRYLLSNVDAPVFFEDGTINLKSSTFHNAYVNGTLGLKIAPRGKKGGFLELNGFGGVNFRTKQKQEFRSPDDERVERESRARYGVNRFNYGVSAAIGYKWVSIYGRYDASSLFENKSVYDYHPLSVGIKMNFF